jgi:serine/threonine-protein kinase RsbW
MLIKKRQISISTDTLKLYCVESFIKDMFRELQIREELFGKVLICVNEAVLNSIQHGNKFDADKKITILSYITGKYLFFRIVDEGEGFDYNDLPDPTTKENINKETGRGIFIIRNISDQIVFREKGKIIEFKIKMNDED